MVEEVDEKIALKDAEITVLNDRLRNDKSQLQSSSDVKTQFRHTKKFASLHMVVAAWECEEGQEFGGGR